MFRFLLSRKTHLGLHLVSDSTECLTVLLIFFCHHVKLPASCCAVAAVTFQVSPKETAETYTALLSPRMCLLVTYRVHADILFNMFSNSFHSRRSCSPSAFHFFVLYGWHEKASHPQNMFSKAKRPSGSRVCHFWMYVQRPAAVRLSSQPHCGSSQVPVFEDDVQQDCRG